MFNKSIRKSFAFEKEEEVRAYFHVVFHVIVFSIRYKDKYNWLEIFCEISSFETRCKARRKMLERSLFIFLIFGMVFDERIISIFFSFFFLNLKNTLKYQKLL